MRHALFLPIFGELAEPQVVARLAAEAEEAGWDGVFVWDHVAYRAPVTDIADPWITLAAIATATERITIGPLVTPLPRRRPMVVARQTATLDRLCGGRSVLGVGIGDDFAGEFSGTGEQTDARTRGAMLDEALEVVTAAWTGVPLQHRGAHYVLDGIAVLPRPVRRPPVWVAMRHGNAAPLRRAARHDGVFPVGLDDPAQLADIVTAVSGLRAADAAPFDVVCTGPAGSDPAPWEAAGATWRLVGFPPGTVHAAEVRQALRAGPPR